VYFSNPASKVFGQTVHTVREALGRQLAREAPADADYVMPMPDSGRSAALGFARESGIPFEEGIVPNRFVGRTFILPEPLILDTTPPRVRLTVVPGSPVIPYKTSEQAAVYGLYKPVGSPNAHSRVFPGRRGAIHAHPAKLRKGITYRVTVFAIDQAGNRSRIYPAGTFTP